MTETAMEIELKYRIVDRAIGERLLNAETLGGFRATGAPRPTQHEDRYLDTADGLLARAGYAARLRTSAGGTVVTVKSLGSSGDALHTREELEGPADRSTDPSGWPASGARSLVLELCGDAPLIELVTVRQFRRKRDLIGRDDEASIELSLDEVDVVSRGRVVERFLELELELTRGSTADLAPVQALLDGYRGLTPATDSKLERALQAIPRPAGQPTAVEPAPEAAAEVATGTSDELGPASVAVASVEPEVGSEPAVADEAGRAGPAEPVESLAVDAAQVEPKADEPEADEPAAELEAEAASEAGSEVEPKAETATEADVEAGTDAVAGAEGLELEEPEAAEPEAEAETEEPEADGEAEEPEAEEPEADGEAEEAETEATEAAEPEAEATEAAEVETEATEAAEPEAEAESEEAEAEAAKGEATEAVSETEEAEPAPEPEDRELENAERLVAAMTSSPEDGPVEGKVIDIEALDDAPELIEEAEAVDAVVLGTPPAAAVLEIPVGKTPGVTADDLHAEAGRKVLRFHLARMVAREPGTREGDDPEELHAMRVSTRRMRAAWRVFGDGFRPERTRRYRRRLRLVAARLGTVRDLDVLLLATEAFAETLPATEKGGLEPLLGSWREQRDAGRKALVRELDSAGHRRFVEAYTEFVMTPGLDVQPVDPTHPHRVRDTAGSRIWLAYEQVRAYEAVLKWADVPTLHQLRIEAKRLRYTLEFVREALGPEAPALISRVVALQDHLGAMNDAEVAAHMARTFLVEHSGGLSDAESAAIGRYLVAREREVARLKRTVGVPWRGIAGLTFRRALGRTLAAL